MCKRIFPQLLLIALAFVSVNKTFAQENLPDVVRRVKPAVVAIATYDANGDALMTGSGFFVRPGQVVTNLHVIRGARRCEIKTLDGKGKVFPVAGTLAIDEEGDLALLSVDMPPERARAPQAESNRGTDQRSEMGNRAAEVMEQTKQAVADAYDRTSRSMQETYEQAIDYGRENPGKITLIAFGAGIGVGLLLASSFSSSRSRNGRIVAPVMTALSEIAVELFR